MQLCYQLKLQKFQSNILNSGLRFAEVLILNPEYCL